MATIYSDNFSSDTSSKYSEGEYITAGTFSISGGQLSVTRTSAYCVYTNSTAHSAVADCSVSFKRITGSGFDAGPCARRSTSENICYYLDAYSTNSFNVYRRIAGSDTEVAARTTTLAANDIYKLEVSGTGATVTIRVYKNGVQVGADITDTNAARITDAGQTGIFYWENGVIDDFLVEDLAAAGTWPHPTRVFRGPFVGPFRGCF